MHTVTITLNTKQVHFHKDSERSAITMAVNVMEFMLQRKQHGKIEIHDTATDALILFMEI